MTKIGYQPFGENGTLASNGYYYTARRFDPESSLYYYRSRMYCPAWGRFCQPDAIGYVGGINLYAYVGNDPLNLTDPYGLWFVSLDVGGLGKGIVSLGGVGGIAFGTGGIATYAAGSAGSGAGEQAEIGIHLGFSPSGSVANLSGPSVNVGVTGGEGVVVGADVSTDALGGNKTYGANLGLGLGTPLTVREASPIPPLHVGRAETWHSLTLDFRRNFRQHRQIRKIRDSQSLAALKNSAI